MLTAAQMTELDKILEALIRDRDAARGGVPRRGAVSIGRIVCDIIDLVDEEAERVERDEQAWDDLHRACKNAAYVLREEA